MMTRLLSDDCRAAPLAAVLVVLVWRWPRALPGPRHQGRWNVAAKVLVFIVLVASFDLLLGYTGIVSFAHTMFFRHRRLRHRHRQHPHRAHLGGAAAMGLAGAGAVAAAVAGHRSVLAARARDLLRDDHAGRGLRLPDAGLAAVGVHRRRGRPDLQAARRCCRPASSSWTSRCWASASTAGCSTTCCSRPAHCWCWRCCASSTRPSAVLQAIRENEFRAEAIGYRTVVYRTIQRASALFACLAGAMLALWLRYNGPDTSLSFEIMMDVLLIVVIGGMGMVYGAIHRLGAVPGGAELPAGSLRLGAEAAAACPGWPRCSRPTAGCCGWACCSCCRSTTSHRHRRPAARAQIRRPRPRSLSRLMPTTPLPESCYLPAGAEIHCMDWGRRNARRWSPGTAWRAPGATWTSWPPWSSAAGA